MVDYHYDDNIYRKLIKKRRGRLALAGLLLIIFIAIVAIIIDAIRVDNQTQVIDTQESILGISNEPNVFNETFYTIEMDPSWEKIPTDSSLSSGTPKYKYRSIKDGLVLRELTVYIDSIPLDKELTYVLPVEVDGNGISPGTISPKCDSLINFDPETDRRVSVEAQWFGVKFICDPDRGAAIVGTSHSADGYKLAVPGSEFEHKYFFVFNDVAPTPHLQTFANILKTFKAK